MDSGGEKPPQLPVVAFIWAFTIHFMLDVVILPFVFNSA